MIRMRVPIRNMVRIGVRIIIMIRMRVYIRKMIRIVLRISI